MNTENKIAEQLHQQTIDLQAVIIANQQRDIDRLNSLAIDNAEEKAKLKATIKWYQGEITKLMGAAAKVEAVTLGPTLVGDERVAERRTGELLAEILAEYRNGERELPSYADLRELCPAASAAPAEQAELGLPELCEQFQAAATLGAPYTLSAASCAKLFDAMTTAPAAPLPELTGPSEALPVVAWLIDSYDCYDKLHQTVELSPLEDNMMDESSEAEPLCTVASAQAAIAAALASPSPAPAQPIDPKGGLDIDDVIAELGIADEVAAIRAEVAPARQQEPDPDDSGPPCATCGGHGIVSHFVHNESAPGYEDQPCPDCSAETAAPGASTEPDTRLAEAVAWHGGKWPEQLESGVMFFKGLRITRAEFLDQRAGASTEDKQ